LFEIYSDVVLRLTSTVNEDVHYFSV